MKGLGVLTGKRPATWRERGVHMEGPTLLPEQEWTHLSSWRELVQQQERTSSPSASSCLPGSYRPGQPPRKGRSPATLLPTADFLALGTQLLRAGLASFMAPVGRYWQHLQSVRVYHLGSKGPIVLTAPHRSELKSFHCLKSTEVSLLERTGKRSQAHWCFQRSKIG